MTPDPVTLERECRTLVRVFSRAPASPYLLSKYIEAHRSLDQFVPRTAFDSWLLRFACGGTSLARVADSYARHFAPRSTLRRKLILILALVEVMPPYHRAIAPAVRSSILAFAVLIGQGLAGAVLLLPGILLIGPVHLLTRHRGGVRE